MQPPILLAFQADQEVEKRFWLLLAAATQTIHSYQRLLIHGSNVP